MTDWKHEPETPHRVPRCPRQSVAALERHIIAVVWHDWRCELPRITVERDTHATHSAERGRREPHEMFRAVYATPAPSATACLDERHREVRRVDEQLSSVVNDALASVIPLSCCRRARAHAPSRRLHRRAALLRSRRRSRNHAFGRNARFQQTLLPRQNRFTQRSKGRR